MSHKAKIFLAGFLIVVAFVWLAQNRHLSFFSKDTISTTDSTTIRTTSKRPVVLYGMTVTDLGIIEDHVKRNQRFFDLFDSVHVPSHIFQQLTVLSKKIFDFRKIGANKKYTLVHEQDSAKTVRALIYEPNPVDYVIFHLHDSLQVEVRRRPVVTMKKSISGRIETSLSETIEQLHISPELTNKFVDIFGWQVDFQRLQKGDQFKLIYEEYVVENKPIGIGKIVGIYFEHLGKGKYAIPFDQGEGIEYFDEAGNSLRKALLKYPIEFTRISSRYNRNRFHPVAKVYRPHLGTDFAAPQGTPIRSVGNGVVKEARYTSNNGNYVKIYHSSTYTTGYLHMSKIASGITAGKRVRQGQTIGYVGSTGLATGPHLCYRFWRLGVQVDALRMELPPSQPVKKDRLPDFQKNKEDCIAQLQQIPLPSVAEDITANR